MEATFKNHGTGHEVVIDLRGDFWGGSADLSAQGGPVIAQISRQIFGAREMFSDSNSVCLLIIDWSITDWQYFVTVAPGVDLALVAAICICFDEAKNDKKD